MHALRIRRLLRAFLGICAFSICAYGNPCTSADSGAAYTHAVSAGAASRVTAQHLRSPLPLSFEVNHGQADSRAKFLARGRDVGLFFTDQGAVLALTKPAPLDDHRLPGAPLQRDAALPQTRQSLALRYQFAGANRHPRIEALDPLPGHSNYFIGNDPKYWRTDIPQSRCVRYHEVYPGVDVVYYGKDGQLEFDVEAAADVDLAQVRLHVDGADSLALDDEGNLLLNTALGVLTQRKPVVYQMIGSERRELRGGYLLRDIRRDKSAHEVAFQVADYDRRYAVVLDPSLVFAKLVGGTGYDDGYGVAVDSSGNSYVAGSTNSPVFPTTPGAYQTAHAGYDAFITKISADGTTLIYSTLIGGNGSDIAYGIGIDNSGNAYITGSTSSTNFPLVNALQSTPKSGFVTALNAAGNGLNYSTYLDASGGYAAVAVDASGNAYVTGQTYSTSFPVSPGAFQATNAGSGDAFVAKLNAAGGRVYATYLGGTAYEEGRAIAIDSDGDAYIAGDTMSASFNGVIPAKLGPLGGGDMLIAELNPQGTGLVYATEIGGTGLDEAIGIAVDGGHQVYFTAFSNSGDLPPTTPPQHTGVNEAYIGHLDDSGTVLYDFTWYGATDGTQAYGYAIDLDEARQSLYVAGQIQSYPGANSLGNTPSINSVPTLDCASSCWATTGAFLLQYSINPLTLASATRVTGGSATNAIFNAVAHGPVSGRVAAVGSSDGNPPTTVATNVIAGGATSAGSSISINQGGDDLVEAIVDFLSSNADLPPEIDKYFTPAEIDQGQQVLLTIAITNPNIATTLRDFQLHDSLPACLLVVDPDSVVLAPPSCAASMGWNFNPGAGRPPLHDVFLGKSALSPGESCSITFKVQADGSAPCDNVTDIPTVSFVNNGKAAKAHLEVISPPLKVWTAGGANTNTSNGANWNTGTAPVSYDNELFPIIVGKPTLLTTYDDPVEVNQMSFSGDNYTVIGSPGPVKLRAGVNNSGANNTFSAQIKAMLPLVFANNPAAAKLNMTGGIDLNGNNVDCTGPGTCSFDGPITGTGDVGCDGPGTCDVNASPSFIGNFNVAGSKLFMNIPIESEAVKLSANGTVRGTCSSFGDIVINDNGDFHPCTGTTQCTPTVASVTCNGGSIELDCAVNNTSCSSVNASGAVQINPGTTLKVNFQTQPTVGATFNNLITTPGTISGCFGETAATPANVLLVAQCTSSSVSAIVRAVDDLFHSSFGG